MIVITRYENHTKKYFKYLAYTQQKLYVYHLHFFYNMDFILI